MSFLWILLVSIFSASAQEYKVESFEIAPQDLSARTEGMVDFNGRKCALIKVYVKDVITETDGPVVGEIRDRGMEKWIYLSHDAKQVKLLFGEHMPIQISFEEFGFPSLTGQMTYLLKLADVEGPRAASAAQPAGGSDDVETFTVNGVTFEMVKVEGGNFDMGSDSGEKFEKPVHSENIGTFSIGRTEVTQRLWAAVMGSNPSVYRGENMPVENVSWYDCQEFVERLSRLTGRIFRLPTEAEWEFAAKGGNKSRGYTYSGGDDLYRVGWCNENSGNKTHPVAQKIENELGLYDMSGNVWEWCSDNWRDNYSSSRKGSERVNRGGGWGSGDACRVTNRRSKAPGEHNDGIGLRLAL